MKNLDPNHIGLILGIFAGLMHLVWGLLVMFGFAQTVLDFAYGLHFLNNPFTTTGFSISKLVMLVIFTFIVGYIVGWVFAYIWNMVHERK